MSNTNTGGPAFPRAGNEWADMAWVEAPAKDGMTMRDYFAAKAMQGLMGRSWANTATGKFPENLHDIWATAAYQMADAMLKARDA